MTRYRLLIEYDGTPFAGWQRQANGFSVQEALERAILAFTGEAVTVKGAGRTDSGVHARGQGAHIDLAAPVRTDTIRDAANAHLRPHPVAVLAVEEVPEGFDARFSAIARAYLYRIVDRRSPLALDVNRAWHVQRPLDADAMHEAAQLLLGKHDFSTFRAAECQADSPMRTLDRLDVRRVGDGIAIETEARSFLHRQVRSMAGSLKLVGEGRWSPGDLKAALDAADRAACGPVAPAHALYLMRVDYPTAK